MREIVLIRITGRDKPGISHTLTEILAKYDVGILDISQAVIHDALVLGLLIEIPERHSESPLFKELLYTCTRMGLAVGFDPVDEDRYEEWVAAQGKKRHIVTLFGRSITADHFSRLAKAITDNGLNIDAITRLSGRTSFKNPDPYPRACVELSVRGEPSDFDGIRRAFMSISTDTGIDIAFQEDNIYRRSRRLIAFDMDSTLIQDEGIDILAAKAGVEGKVAAITERAMRGEIDFEESLRARVGYLEGLDESALQATAEEIRMTEGAERLIYNLKQLGYTVAIISGGFTYFGERLKDALDVDYMFANELEIKDGKLTGKLLGDIVDAERKATLLKEIADREGVGLQQTVAVGDGANDLKMLGIAGLGIAFHAKPIVKEGCEQSISTLGLDGILYILGMRDREAFPNDDGVAISTHSPC